jgi:MFS family permease
MLALPLTAVFLLDATPTQMGFLMAIEIAPFVLFSLPGGVLIDRMRKLPLYIAGEIFMGLALLTIPAAWALGHLTMPLMYAVSFALGTVYTIAGSASQIVLTQLVGRDKLVQAYSQNAIAGSMAEVMGPGLAGVLIRVFGAPLALVMDALLLIGSAGMAITLATMAFIFGTAPQVDGVPQLSGAQGPIALVAANLFVVAFGMSWGPVVWVLLGEMFPNRIRAAALGLAAAGQWAANWLITVSFPELRNHLGVAYGFYALCAILSFLFVWTWVRETKGVSLEDMQGELAAK